jgi:DNA repair protein RadA/Sms
MPDNNASVAKALDGADADNTILLSNVKGGNTVRIQTGPWDPCFGMHYTRERRIGRNGHFIDDGGPVYGLVKTSTTLIGGEPGAGKTTMALQICDGIANTTQREIIYVGAEQAAKEIRDTFDRLRLKNHHLMRIVPLGSDANIAQILLTRRPCAAVFDSLPGLGLDAEEGVSFCKALKGYAVELEAPILVIDHVTKADNFAGLKALQHEVDTLVTLRGEKDEPRELASTKNRHGACVEMTLIMTEWGLRAATKEELEEEEEDEDE